MASGNGFTEVAAAGNMSATQKHGTSLRKMECLVCQKVVFPPVMQCKNWHLICNNCRQNRETCPNPECKEEISSATRSGVAEKFLEKYITRCKYFKEGLGCLEATLKDETESMTDHEIICPLREVNCLIPGCNKMIPFTLLPEHFEKEHLLPSNDKPSVLFNVSQMILEKQIVNETCGGKCVPSYLKHSDDIFLALFRISSIRQPVFEISTVIHPYYSNLSIVKDDTKHACKISVVNEEDQNAWYKWEGPTDQQYPLSPVFGVSDERAKLKWMVNIEILQKI